MLQPAFGCESCICARIYLHIGLDYILRAQVDQVSAVSTDHRIKKPTPYPRFTCWTAAPNNALLGIGRINIEYLSIVHGICLGREEP
jgi:hypothetical protein